MAKYIYFLLWSKEHPTCRSFGDDATLAIFPNRYHNDFVAAFLYSEGHRKTDIYKK